MSSKAVEVRQFDITEAMTHLLQLKAYAGQLEQILEQAKVDGSLETEGRLRSVEKVSFGWPIEPKGCQARATVSRRRRHFGLGEPALVVGVEREDERGRMFASQYLSIEGETVLCSSFWEAVPDEGEIVVESVFSPQGLNCIKWVVGSLLASK